jgi:N-acetylglucosamine-6-sulfatase
VQYGHSAQDYLTDVIRGRATDFVSRAASGGSPFFLLVAPYAPHGPSTPAPRHQAAFGGEIVPRTPSFDEADVSDKPSYIQDLPRLTPQQILQADERHRNRLRCMQAVDEMVQALCEILDAAALTDNTYVIFTSDNGFQLGQHRLIRKGVPYEESTTVPLVVRGPGIAQGTNSSRLAGFVDIMPTILDLAGCTIPSHVDGRSLRPILHGESCLDWRQALLLENEAIDEFARVGTPLYYALRTDSVKYVEYSTGERELYHLRIDPYELNNAYASTPEATKTMLSGWLHSLQTSAGAVLRDREAFHVWLPAVGVAP